MTERGFLRSVLTALAITTAPVAFAAERELVVFNWPDYLDPGVIADFEAEHDARVEVVHYGDDDSRDELMAETDGRGFDVIVVNGPLVDFYQSRGWIRPLDQDLLPNRHHVDERWIDGFTATREYGVPYFWGTIGIAYREDLVSAPITSWMQLYRPGPELAGRIVMTATARDVLGMALKALGHSVNADDPNALVEAGRLALEQKPSVLDYSYVSIGEDSALVTGAATAALVYGGDALSIAQHNENVVYVLPEEGGGIWCDYLTISATSNVPKLAHAFIDFLNRPAIAARQAEAMFLASPNAAARELLDAQLLNDPVIYPDAEALSRSEFFRPQSTRTLRLQSQIFTRVTE